MAARAGGVVADDATEGRDSRGRFVAGCAGRRAGSRHKVSRAIEKLMEGEAEALTRKAIDLAKAGDIVALRLCLDRLAPPRKDSPINFDLPKVECAADHPAALAAIMEAVASGDLTPTEGQALAAMLAEHRKAIETADLETRVAALEGASDETA